MSYLLDALNKSKNQQAQTSHSPITQSIVYPQHVQYDNSSKVNIYQWLCVVLALILTLIIGIVLGDRYTVANLLSTEKDKTPPVAITQSVPVPSSTPDPTDSSQSTQSILAETAEPAKTAELAKTTKPAEQSISATNIISPTPSAPTMSQLVTSESTTTNSGNPALQDISSELLKKFNQAIQQTEGVGSGYEQTFRQQTDLELEEYLTKVPKITELTNEQQQQIPAMTYDAHVYASDHLERWVKINGQSLQETQWIDKNIQIYEIQPQFLVLEMGHIRFSIESLSDWLGFKQ